MDKSVEYGLNELVGGTVDSVTAKLGELGNVELVKLLEVEKKGADRAGLTRAIERELQARRDAAKAADAVARDAKAQADHAAAERTKVEADAGAAQPAPDAGNDNTERSYSEAEVAALRSEHASELANAARDKDQRIASLEAELGEARKQIAASAKVRPAKAVKAMAPRKLALTGEGGTDGLRIAFAGADDMSLPDIPELDFGSHAFEKIPGGRTTLNVPIAFPPTLGVAQVASVWVVDGAGKAVAVSRLVNPLPVGGGSEAEIPKNFLAFTGRVPVATAPAV